MSIALASVKNYFTSRANLQFIIIAFITISLPWHEFFSFIPTMLLFLWYVLDINLPSKIIKGLKCTEAWPFYVVALWYVLRTNFASITTITEVYLFYKLFFLFIPLIFASENHLNAHTINQLLYMLFISCALSALYCELVAVYNYTQTKQAYYWVYMNLCRATYWHATCVANFFTLAVVWYILNIISKKGTYVYLFSKVLFVVCIIFIIQLISKTATLFFIFFIAWLLWYAFKKIPNYFYRSLLVIFLISGIFFSSLLSNKILPGRYNMSELKNVDSTILFANSMGSRYAAVTQAYKAVRPVYYKGYGTGQAYENLRIQLKRAHYNNLVLWHMKPHNQFMNIWLEIGLFGVLYFILLFIGLIYLFVKRKNYVAMWFTILFAINFLTYDILEIFGGIVFFVLWISIFLFTPAKQKL